jgi:DNA polymerase sigma
MMMQLQPFFNLINIGENCQAFDGSGQFVIDKHEMIFCKALGEQILQMNTLIDSYLHEAEEAKRLSFELISQVARDTFPELSLDLEIYGSTATKLAIDTSDLDIAIYGVRIEART